MKGRWKWLCALWAVVALAVYAVPVTAEDFAKQEGAALEALSAPGGRKASDSEALEITAGESGESESDWTEESSTEESSTEGSSTEESSTEGSSTEESSTEGSSTEESSTEESSTEESSTEESSTEESSTEAIETDTSAPDESEGETTISVTDNASISPEEGEAIELPSGKWKVDGDPTVYHGGVTVYAAQKKTFVFRKQK